MLPRPKSTEGDKELIRQDQDFRNSLQKNSKSNNLKKRKQECDLADSHATNEQITKPVSIFKEAMKKRKEAVMDNTQLPDVLSQKKEMSVVLGKVVARNVPLLAPPLTLSTPTPTSSPHGFPEAFKLNLVKLGASKNVEGKEIPKMSLSMRHLVEEEGYIVQNKLPHASLDDKIVQLGERSFVIDGTSGLGNVDEAAKIHQENMSKLSQMSHEERLDERNDLLKKLNDEQIEFLKSLRRQKSSSNFNERANDKGSIQEGLTDEPMEVEELDKNDLPIAPAINKQWLHMDKAEKEKMRWMSEVPPLRPLKRNEGFVARFNLEGDLLPYDSDVSWREGLHHHGEEPGRAGYSLDELFMFVRSKVVQQRHIGLQVLANILRNAKEGVYDNCFDSPIIQLMVEAGIVILARFALDDSVAAVHREALRVTYFLLVSEPDERCLALVEPFYPSGLQPGVSSATHAKEKDREELDSEEEELKDSEILQLDIIRALIRMDLLLRLRYLLEEVKLSPSDVLHIVGILTRLARHSLTAAWAIVNTPRLLSVIVKQFLPRNVTPLITGQRVDKMTSVYGVPLRHILLLFKVLSGRGRHLASHLVEAFDTMSRIVTYVSVEPSEMEMPLQESLLLSLESYSLWARLLSYGLTKPQETLKDFLPMLIKQLLFYKDKIDINRNVEENKFNYDLGSNLIQALSQGLLVASTRHILLHRMKRNVASGEASDGRPEIFAPPDLDWDLFSEIFSLIKICFTKWFIQLARGPLTSFSGLRLVGSACSFLDIYVTKWKDQRSYAGQEASDQIKELYDVLVPFFSSESFAILIQRLGINSSFLSDLKSGSGRDPKNLDSLSCVAFRGKVVPILQPSSPFPLLLPLFQLTCDLLSENPSLKSDAIHTILTNHDLVSYLTGITKSRKILGHHWLTRIEYKTIFHLLQIAYLKGSPQDPLLLFHEVSLHIVPFIRDDDAFLFTKLLTTVICNEEFCKDLMEVENRIDSLTMADYKLLQSPAIAQPILSHSQLTETLYQDLPSIATEYKKNLFAEKVLNSSAVQHSRIPFVINSFTINESTDRVLDPYWCFSPLKSLQYKSIDNNEDQTTLSVIKWLEMSYLILKYRKSYVSIHVDQTAWLRHLSLVFTASDHLFLDRRVSAYLQASLKVLLKGKDGLCATLNSSLTLNGLSSYDWYKKIVEQYSAVSYGDYTFALFILLPLQRYWPASFKLLLFNDEMNILPFIRLSEEDVGQFMPLEQFYEPLEDNFEVITAYKNSITTKTITKDRQTFLFNLVSHHVDKYVSK